MWNLGNWAAIAQIAQAVIVLFALIYTVVQLNEVGKARKLQATRDIMNERGGEDVRKDRWWVLYEMDPDLTKLNEDQRWKALRIAVAYDRVGYMVKQHLIPEDALFYFQQDEIKMLWEKLEPVVKEEQKRRPNHCKRFEDLYKEWLPLMEKRMRK
jgi:hypothetical protein